MLRIDYEALGESANVLSNEGNKFEDCIQTMQKEVNKLPDIWEANTCDEYCAQFNESRKTLDKVRELIEDMSRQMKQISANFREADQSMAKQMRG